MLRTTIIALLFIGTSLTLLGQTRRIDSLLNRLEGSVELDTSRVEVLADLAFAYYTVSPQKTAEYANEALQLSERLGYDRGLARGHQVMGIAHAVRGNYPSALESNLLALSIFRKINHFQGVANSLNNLSGIYFYLGDYEKALHYNQQSTQVHSAHSDSLAVADTYLARGLLYAKLDQTDAALETFERALKIYQRRKDTLHWASTYNEIGGMFSNTGRHLTALRYYQEALTLKRAIGDITGISTTLIHLGETYLKLKQFRTAESTLQEGLRLAEELQSLENQKKVYQLQAELSSERGRYKQALSYFDRYMTIKDSLYNERRSQQLAELETRYQSEQNRQENQLLKKEKELSDVRLEATQATIHIQRMVFLGVILLLVILVSGLGALYRINTHRRKANDKLALQKAEMQQQKEELEALNRTKDQWFSILGHDFRYPLHFLQHALSLINEGNLNAREREMLTRELEQRARNAGNLLDNLLYWAQGQLEDIKLTPSYLSVHDLVDQGVQYLADQASKKGVIITNSVPATLRAWGDEETLKLVIRNLVENAIKFSFRGDVVRIEASETAHYAVVSVQDHGIGISEEAQNRLFQPDQPYATVGTARERGTGIGLILSRDIIRRNGGDIQLESEPGQGSTFLVTIPRSEKLVQPQAKPSTPEATERL